MRIKPVPPAGDLATVSAAHQAISRVPTDEAACTVRLMNQLGVHRDDAGRWLAFLRGLELVHEGPRGFSRTPANITRKWFVDALVEGIYGINELVDILEEEDKPLTVETVFNRFTADVPPWERYRDPDWQTTWHEGVKTRLDWLVVADVVATENGHYRIK